MHAHQFYKCNYLVINNMLWNSLTFVLLKEQLDYRNTQHNNYKDIAQASSSHKRKSFFYVCNCFWIVQEQVKLNKNSPKLSSTKNLLCSNFTNNSCCIFGYSRYPHIWHVIQLIILLLYGNIRQRQNIAHCSTRRIKILPSCQYFLHLISLF